MPPPLVNCHDRIKHRFSARRLAAVVNALSDKQKIFVRKYGFEKLLDIKWFSVPVPLLEWVMDHIIVDLCQFVHKKKSIKLTKLMFQQVFGIPSGSTPVILHSANDAVVSQFLTMKSAYCAIGEDKVPISHVISLLLQDENEESFIRSFLLIVLSTVVCPSTQNFVNLNYLYNLIDISMIKEIDWAGHGLSYILSEVKRYQGKVASDEMVDGSSFYFGSCLPFLAIVYMDFLDLYNPDNDRYHLNYGLPRICNVSTADFNFVMSVDRNTSSLDRNSYGVINFRDFSSTPYSNSSTPTTAVMQSGHVNSSTAGESSSSISFDVHPSIVPIVKKHCAILRTELSDKIAATKTVNSSLQNQMLPIFAKRLSLLSCEIFTQVLSTGNDATRFEGATLNEQLFNTPSYSNVRNDNTSHMANDNTISVPTATNDISISSSSNKSTASRSLQLRAINDDRSTDTGTNIAMSFASPQVCDELHESPKQCVGSSTFNKRHRRKRHAISFEDDDNSIKLHVDNVVEEMYKKYITKIYIKKSLHHESPMFVVMNGYHASYERFRGSLKQQGDVTDDVMSLFVHQFNNDHKIFSADPLSRNKIAFSPFFSYKLDFPVEDFEPESLEAELTRINADLPLSQADLLFFPMYKFENWMLVVINTVFQEINVFDPFNAMPPRLRDGTVSNLVQNFQLLCKEAEILDTHFQRYRVLFPLCPKVSSVFLCYRRDSGIFVMLYIEYWDGQVMKVFDHDDASVFRKILVHKLITSPLNEIKDLKNLRVGFIQS